MCRLWFALALVAGLVLAPATRADDLTEGVRAYDESRYDDSFRLLRPLADQGVTEAEYRVGLLLIARFDGQQLHDPMEGLRFLHRAAERGHGRAMSAIARQHLRGSIIPQNSRAALEWFARATEAGDPYAEDWVIWIIYHGAPGVRADQEQARSRAQVLLQMRERHALAGDPVAMVDLGLMYWRHDTIPRNAVLARMWVERAANMDNPPAQFALSNLLGSIILDGRQRGIPEHELPAWFEGLMWLALAAANNHPEARPIWERARANLRPDDAAEVDRLAREWRARRSQR